MHPTVDRARRQVERIIALMLVLAVVADRACRAPAAVRLHVLSLLLPAELAARNFVFGEMGLIEAPPADDDDADLAVLAARFCLLAVALAGISVRLSAGARRHDGFLSRRRASKAAGVARDPRCPACAGRRPFDTS